MAKPTTSATVDYTNSLASKLSGAWIFNEGAGTTAKDYSSGNHTGTLTNGPTWIASGLNFGGNTQVVNISNFAISTPYSIYFIIRPTGIGNPQNYQAIFSQDTNKGVFLQAGVGGTQGKINFYFGGDHVSNTAMTNSGWFHGVVVDDATGITYYLNTSGDGTAAATSTSITVKSIGNDEVPEFYQGDISTVYLFNRVLTSGDVTSLYNNPYSFFTEPGGGGGSSNRRRIIIM